MQVRRNSHRSQRLAFANDRPPGTAMAESSQIPQVQSRSSINNATAGRRGPVAVLAIVSRGIMQSQ
jgi:hypothetical protein